MAFCVIEKQHREAFQLLVNQRINKDKDSLKNFKQFSKDIFAYLVSKGQSVERAIALVRFLPQAVSDYSNLPANRKALRDAGVSLDAIADVEDQFKEYEPLAKYLGIKSEATPLVVVNDNQLAQEAKLTKLTMDNKVEIVGDARVINGKRYQTRVTSIAKVGFEDKEAPEEQPQTPALKHGNTVDTIAKAIFDGIEPQFKDFQDLIESTAFDTLVAKIKQVKTGLETKGYIFKTAVTVFNSKLSVSGEIDLVAITPEGKAFIFDFKTAKQRFNESYLKTDSLTYKSDQISETIPILSKWKQYGTQGYIYAKMLEDMSGISSVDRTGIIGININYDTSVPLAESKITKVNDTEIHNIPFSESRSEFLNKDMTQIVDEFNRLSTQAETGKEEIVQKKPLSRNRKRRELDRTAVLREAAATDAELKAEINWFENNPVGKDTLLRIMDVVNAGKFGQFKLDGITIWKNASKGTIYHEGWHRFSQVFMTKAQKTELYKSVQNDAIKYRTRDGRRINTSKATFLDIEEFLADEFAKYALNPENYKYPTNNDKPKNLFQRIWEFLKRFFGTNPRPIELFQKLHTGNIFEYVPSVNNAYWGNLNSLAVNNQGEEIVSNERFPLYVRAMDYLVGKELRDRNKSFTAFKQSKALQSAVIDNVFLALEEKYNDPTITQDQADELFSILENERDFTRAYLAATSYQTLKDFTISEDVFNMSTEELAAFEEMESQYEDVEDYDETEELDSKPERFDRAGNEDSAFSIADYAIQDFFRTIPKIKNVRYDQQGNPTAIEYEMSELGFPENHKYYDVFYKTKKILSGALDMDTMQARMRDKNNQRIFPELAIIDEFMSRFISVPDDKNFYRSVQNIQFVQAFYHVMVMPEVPNMQLTQNYLPLSRDYVTYKPTMVSYRTASRALSLKIIKTWEKNFKDRRGKTFIDARTWDSQKGQFGTTPLYLTEDGKLMLNPFVDYTKYPSTLDGIRSFWETMGVNFNPKVFEDPTSVRQLLDIKNVMTKNLSAYKSYLLNQLQTDMAGLLEYVTDEDAAGVNDIVQEYFINNPVNFFNEKKQYTTVNEKGKAVANLTESMRFMFEDMAATEEKFGERISSGSFKIEDKTKYPYYIPNQLLITTEMINQLDRTSDFALNTYLQNLDPLKNPWMKRSLFMKRLFDQNGNRAKDSEGKPMRIIVEDIASVRILKDDGDNIISVTEKSPRSLTADEKFFMDVLTMFRAGAIEIPRAETSSTMFVIRLSDYGRGKLMPIGIQDVIGKGNAMPENFHAIVKDYFAAEIEKRQWFKDNDTNVKGANKKPLANQFNVFEGILSKEFKDKVVAAMDAGQTADQILSDQKTDSEFRREIEDYFNAQIAEIRPKFDGTKTGLSEDQKEMLRDTLGSPNLKSFGSVAKAFVLNQFILSQEFYQLYFGDLYFYKNSFKRGKYVTNTGNTFFVDELRNQLLNGIQNSTLNSIITGKKPGGKDFRVIKTSIMNDVEMQSAYVNDNDNQNRMLNDILNMRVASGALQVNTPQYAAAKAAIKDNLQKYNLINIADGQGIIGLDFYRNFSIMTNIWSEEKEREYERQKAIFRSHYDLYFKLDESGQKVRMTGEELVQAKAADAKLVNSKPTHYFNPLKISYTGPQVKDGPTRPVFDKFSVRPIIPEMAIGKRDEGLLMEMANKDIDYVKFKSGSKVYQDTAFDWYNQLSEGKYDLNDFRTEEIEPNELHAGFLKHQLSTEKFKSENIFGSQFRKIVFGVKYSPLVRDDAKLVNYFTRLEEEFTNAVTELVQVEQNDLFSLLGVQEVRGEFRVADMRKFIKLLQEESIKRGIAINNIEFLQYDEDSKNAKYPIDYAFNRQQIQDLLSGLIDEKMRRLKVNGSALIQVSSAGTESKDRKAFGLSPTGRFRNPTREEIEKYGTTGLHYYHIEYNQDGVPLRTSTMGVKVAMSRDYEGLFKLDAPPSLGTSETYRKYENEIIDKVRDAEGNPIQTAGKIRTPGMSEFEALQRLNQALKDPAWRELHRDKLRLVGYRIPTQNINFTDNMEIMEFLPRSAGSVIVPPIELIVKSGSDFDIDKMNVMRPAINENGALVKAPKESLAEISQAIASLTYEERDVKQARKELKDILAGTAIDTERLEKLQGKVRMTILDLVMKSDVDTSVIDLLMNNIKSGKSNIIPTTNEISEELAFTDNEVVELADQLNSVVLDFYALDQEIERLNAQYRSTASEKGRIEETQMGWFNKKRNYKDAKNNELLQILQKTMSHPYYFELLVTPSSAQMFEGLTNELMASQAKMSPEEFAVALEETDGKLYDRTLTAQQASTYASSYEAFDNLLSKRKDLGGYAIQRTFADVFNFAKFSIAKSYTVKAGKDYVDKVLHTPLIPPADRTKSLVNGRLLMHGDSVTGIPIARSFDELISLTVDLAGAPAYPKMGINAYNKKHVQYLLHQKADPKMVMWFMNQPILKDLYTLYEEKRRKIEGYSLKHAIVELSLRNKILENPNLYENSSRKKYEVLESKTVRTQEDENDPDSVVYSRVTNPKKANSYLSRPYIDLHNQNLKESDYFDLNLMDRAIRGEESPEIKTLQGKVLAYFASITEEADMLMKLQFAENVDTTKYATLTSLIRNEENRRAIRDSDLFDNSQIDLIEKKSMISPFDYTQKAKSILKALFPKLYTNETINSFSRLVNDIMGARNIQIERFSKIIENDFIEFIYKNYGTYQGQNISERFQSYLINTDAAQDHEYFSYKLNALKAEFPELLNVPFVNALYEDVYYPPQDIIQNSYNGLDNKEMHNIFFLRNPDNPTFEKNIFTDNWRNLINFDPEKLGLTESYTTEQIQRIGDFFHELVYFSLYQSGLTNTGNGFSDLIPYEHWTTFIEGAFDAYERDKELNKSLEFEILNVFEVRVRQMNPKINWRTKYEETDDIDVDTGEYIRKPLQFYKNYYRGKDYLVSDDDLKMVRSKNFYSADDLADDVTKPKPESAGNQGDFRIGRAVEFEGTKYVIVKSLRPGAWQVYNPLKEGTQAKLALRENQMTTLNEMHSVVQHGTKNYLVTPKEEIIDLDKSRKMSWSRNNINRKTILELAKSQPKPPTDSGIGPENQPPIEPC